MLMICWDRAAARLWAGVQAMATAPTAFAVSEPANAGTARRNPSGESCASPEAAAERASAASATAPASVSLPRSTRVSPCAFTAMACRAAPSDVSRTRASASSNAAPLPKRRAAPLAAAAEAVVASARSRILLSMAVFVVLMFSTDSTAATRIVAPAMRSRHFLKTDAFVRPRRSLRIWDTCQEVAAAITEAPRRRRRRSWRRSVRRRTDRRW
jgi:hypothetical protein